MTCGNHSIDFKNIDQKSCYSRDLLLIIGSIKNPCDHQSIQYQINKLEFQEQFIVNGNFKVIIRLEKNTLNTLKIKYCETEVDVKLKHESIDPVFYDVQPLYVVPKNHDGKYQSDETEDNSIENAIDKINLLLELAQCVITEKIHETESVEKSFVLQKCQIFNSKIDLEDMLKMNQWDMYDKCAQELIENFGNDIIERRKFVGFISCTKYLGLDEHEAYNYGNIKSKTLANPSLGSGFLALLGNGCFYALPNTLLQVLDAFQSKKIVNVGKFLDESNYRRTYGGCFSTFLGSLVHEMGHIFDLGHTNSGLMGTDIDYVHRFFLCQYFTEIMPKRIISNCQQNEKVEKMPSNRVTRIKKEGTYMEKYHEQKNNDLTFFEKNCSIQLMNHKWFTQKRCDEHCVLYRGDDRIVMSRCGQLVSVEIRECEAKNSILRIFWDLRDENVEKFVIPGDVTLDDSVLVAINTNGCILKKTFQ